MDLLELVRVSHLKTAARLWAQLLERYFRVEVTGIEHIPETGGALILPNHSGFAGADAMLLRDEIKRLTRRMPRILAHRAYFDFSESLKAISEGLGLRKASVEGGVKVLKDKQLLILFPEGEQGNFKSTLKRYKLQKFHTGFLRMALATRAPIVPCLIVGAEESNINLGNLDLSRFVKGLRIPIPLNLIPLPAKWTIHFLKPIDLGDHPPEILDSPQELKLLARKVQTRMQSQLNKIVKNRGYVFSRRLKRAVNQLTEIV